MDQKHAQECGSSEGLRGSLGNTVFVVAQMDMDSFNSFSGYRGYNNCVILTSSTGAQSCAVSEQTPPRLARGLNRGHLFRLPVPPRSSLHMLSFTFDCSSSFVLLVSLRYFLPLAVGADITGTFAQTAPTPKSLTTICQLGFKEGRGAVLRSLVSLIRVWSG